MSTLLMTTSSIWMPRVLDWRPKSDTLECFEHFLRSADAVLVTTENLRQRLSDLAGAVYVLPNALDERLLVRRPAKRADDGCIIIGYMGTRTHDEDLRMILPVLRKILSVHGDRVRVQLLGGTAKDRTIHEMAEMGVEVISPPPHATLYENFVPWFVQNIQWDIGHLSSAGHPVYSVQVRHKVPRLFVCRNPWYLQPRPGVPTHR